MAKTIVQVSHNIQPQCLLLVIIPLSNFLPSGSTSKISKISSSKVFLADAIFMYMLSKSVGL